MPSAILRRMEKDNWKERLDNHYSFCLFDNLFICHSHVARWALIDVLSEHERFESLLRVMPRQPTIAVILTEMKLRVVA